MLKTKDLQAEESSRDLDIEESRPEKIRCSSCLYLFYPSVRRGASRIQFAGAAPEHATKAIS